MVTEILQTWWHIEDIYFPVSGRRIRQVMDLITNEPTITIDSLSDCEFLGLKAIARNVNNKELSFVERKENSKFTIIINLDPITQFPQYTNGEIEEGMYQVKLEIDYILTNVNFTEYNLKWRDKFFPKKYTTHEIQGRIQPEFYLTLPKGWRVSGKIREGDAIILKCFIETQSSTDINLSQTNKETIKLKLNEPFIKINDKNRIYYYLINDASYKELLEKTKLVNNNRVSFKLAYETMLSHEVVGISLFRYVFAGFSFGILSVGYLKWIGKISYNFDCTIGTAYLIVLMGFAYFYSNLVDAGYEMPRRNDFIYIFVFSIIAILSIFVVAIIVGS